MIVYHLDRYDAAYAGQTFKLQPVSLLGLPTDFHALPNIFPNGISQQGISYLQNSASLIDSYNNEGISIDLNSFVKGKSTCDGNILELYCELARKAYFSHHPSRYVSLFAVKSLDDFHLWPELLKGRSLSECSIYEIEVPDDTMFFDSRFLQGGISFGRYQDTNSFFYGFSALLALECVCRYWSGEQSESPRMECVIPLPVTLGNKVEMK